MAINLSILSICQSISKHAACLTFSSRSRISSRATESQQDQLVETIPPMHIYNTIWKMHGMWPAGRVVVPHSWCRVNLSSFLYQKKKPAETRKQLACRAPLSPTHDPLAFDALTCPLYALIDLLIFLHYHQSTQSLPAPARPPRSTLVLVSCICSKI